MISKFRGQPFVIRPLKKSGGVGTTVWAMWFYCDPTVIVLWSYSHFNMIVLWLYRDRTVIIMWSYCVIVLLSYCDRSVVIPWLFVIVLWSYCDLCVIVSWSHCHHTMILWFRIQSYSDITMIVLWSYCDFALIVLWFYLDHVVSRYVGILFKLKNSYKFHPENTYSSARRYEIYFSGWNWYKCFELK